MSVEVKNLQTGETFEVGPEGAIFGREGGPANIKVADQSVSKRHARIFSDGTDWFLEDMGSVNGTIVDGGKIAGTMPLRTGVVFQMSKFRFEVLSIDGRGPQAAPPDIETRTAMRGGQPSNPEPPRRDPIPKKRAPVRDISPPQAQQPPPYEPTNQGRNNNLPLASDQDFPSQSLNSASQQSLPDVDAPRPMLGIDQYDEDISPAAALAQGIGYVMKTAPMLVLNPLGTVRKQIETPPIMGLTKIPLAAFVFPTYAVLILAQTWVGVIATLIAGGGLAIGGIITGPIAAVIGGAIGALIAGFLGHPILSWLVDKLGGQSDARSRTTHIAMGLVTSLVLLIPTMIVAIFSAVAARLTSVSSIFQLINIIPALVMIVATPLPIVVQWFWFKSYNVVKWFQTVLLVFMVLSVLGGLASAVTTVLAAVNAMRGASGVAIPTLPTVPTIPGVDAGVPDVPTNTTPPDPPTNTTPPPTNTTPPPTNTTPPPTNTTPPPTNTTPPPTNTTPPPANTTTTTTSNPAGGADYAEFARRRQAIDDALNRDPTLVQKRGVRQLLTKLSQETYNAEVDAEIDVLGKKRRGDPALRLVLERVKAATVYAQTRSTVNDLYKAINQ